jgi:hypothetical protein
VQEALSLPLSGDAPWWSCSGGWRRPEVVCPSSSLRFRADLSLTLPLLVGQLIGGGARGSRSGDGGPAASTSAHADPAGDGDGGLWSARDEEARPDPVGSGDVRDTNGLDWAWQRARWAR